MSDLLAREQHETWHPITTPQCAGVSRFGPTVWRENGLSWSCSYCGSMSSEEFIECFRNPDLLFSLNDRRDKVYIDRYPHAGDCGNHCMTCRMSEDMHPTSPKYKAAWAASWGSSRHDAEGHDYVAPRTTAEVSAAGGGCYHIDGREHGGPIKFYLYHLLDLPDERERNRILDEANARMNADARRFMEQLRAAAPAPSTPPREGSKGETNA